MTLMTTKKYSLSNWPDATLPKLYKVISHINYLLINGVLIIILRSLTKMVNHNSSKDKI